MNLQEQSEDVPFNRNVKFNERVSLLIRIFKGQIYHSNILSLSLILTQYPRTLRLSMLA